MDTPISPSLNPSPVQESASMPIKKRSIKKTILMVLGAIVVLIGLIIWAAFALTAGVTTAAEDFMGKLKTNNISAAYDMTNEEFRANTTEPAFEQFIKQYPILVGFEKVSFTFRKIVNNEGKVSGTITGADGRTSPITMKLIKEGEVWKVVGMSLEAKDVPSSDEFDSDEDLGKKVDSPTPPPSKVVSEPKDLPEAAEGSSPVAESFLKNLQMNDVKGAYALTTKDFQSATTLEGLEKFLKGYPIIVGFDSVDMPYHNETKDEATFSGTVTGADGKTSPVTIKLVKEGDTWKVLGMSLEPDDVPKE